MGRQGNPLANAPKIAGISRYSTPSYHVVSRCVRRQTQHRRQNVARLKHRSCVNIIAQDGIDGVQVVRSYLDHQ